MSVQVKGSGTIGGLDEGLVVSGIVTSSTQINVGSNIKLGNAGVITATSFVGSGANLTSLPSQVGGALGADFNDNVKLRFGTGNDLEIYHSGTVSFIDDLTGGSDGVSVRGKNVRLQSNANIGAKSAINCIANGAVELFHNNSKKFETTNTGAVVTGIVTATSFSGSGEGLTRTTAYSHRNVVINGAMQIYQRGDLTGSSSHAYGGPDRFRVAKSGAGTFTQSSSGVTGAFGIQRALKLDCTTQSGSLGANSLLIIQHKIEGFNAQRFEKGYSTAKQFALSFYTYSEKGGTYTVALEDANNNRYVSASYTVTANTWEKQEVIFPADTTGKLDNDNGESLNIEWWLAAGSNYSSGTFTTSWASSVSANKVHPSQVNVGESQNNRFYLANVQLEVGSVCTPFEYKSFIDDLTDCQRYYRRWQATSGSFNGNGSLEVGRMTTTEWYDTSSIASGCALDGDDSIVMRALSPPMRRKPTVYVNDVMLGHGLSNFNSTTTLQENRSWTDMLCLHIDNGGGMTAGYQTHLVLKSDAAYMIADAEI